MITTHFQEFKIDSSKDSNIFYLSPEQQKEIDLPFVNDVPWNSFGRKNIGFLFSIARGAETIFDFDDDNIVSYKKQKYTALKRK